MLCIGKTYFTCIDVCIGDSFIQKLNSKNSIFVRKKALLLTRFCFIQRALKQLDIAKRYREANNLEEAQE